MIFGFNACNFSQEKLQFEKKSVEFATNNISINLEFDYPVVQKNTALSNVRKQILSEIFEVPTADIITDGCTLATNFFGSEFDEEEYYEKITTGKSLFTDNSILTYEIHSYFVCSKGAHGSITITYFVFDLKTGKRLTEEDIFAKNYQEIITKIMLTKLKEEEEENAHDYNYNLENVKPNGNFSVNEEGITYLFNPYEIVAYFGGAPQIFIPYEELTSILKKKSPISSLY